MGIQKLVSLKYPSATLYPPVQENLQLYKRLLRNIPLASGQEYQTFLNATSSELNNSTRSSGNTAPLNSTQTSQGRGKSFWRKFSFTRRSYKVNQDLPNRNDAMAMSNLLRSDPLANAPVQEPLIPQIPNATEPSDLNAILTVP